MQKQPNPMFEDPGDELEPATDKPEVDSGTTEDRSRPDVSPRAGEYDEEDHEPVDPAGKDVIQAKDLRDLTKPEPTEDYTKPESDEDKANAAEA